MNIDTRVFPGRSQTSLFEEYITVQSRLIEKDGGTPIPRDVMDSIKEDFLHGMGQRHVERRIQAYRDTTDTARRARSGPLKTAALQSSRLIRLRQRRGLPFKSRRQP